MWYNEIRSGGRGGRVEPSFIAWKQTPHRNRSPLPPKDITMTEHEKRRLERRQDVEQAFTNCLRNEGGIELRRIFRSCFTDNGRDTATDDNIPDNRNESIDS